MYIVYETIASNDPRIDPRIKNIGKFWHFDVAYIDPADEADTRIDWLKGAVIPEHIAFANKFASAVDGEVTLVTKNFTSYDEIVFATNASQMDAENYVREVYFLKPEELKNARDFIAECLKLQVKNYITPDTMKNPVGTDTRLYEVIANAQTLNQIQMVMKSYFDCDVNLYTATRPKQRDFDIVW